MQGQPSSTWRSGAQALLDLVFPRDCILCGARPEAGQSDGLCATCSTALPRIGTDQCAKCGEALGPYAEDGRGCPSCRGRSGFYFKAAAAVCRYDGGARDLVHALKYVGDLRAARHMGQSLADRLRQRDWFGQVEAIIPVPLHWSRRLSRRFNQSSLLARHIADSSNLPVLERVLRRIRRTPSQTHLTAVQRVENVRGGFRSIRPNRIDGKVLLLVDDVMSTCATATECARTLIKAGARTVYVAVFAR